MTDASHIRAVLIHGTQLLAKLAAGSLAPEAFIAQYGNFFHEHALDGHEATAAQQLEFQRFARATALHGELQGVVDLCYRNETPLPAYEAAGRLRPSAVAQRARKIAATYDVEQILEDLDD